MSSERLKKIEGRGIKRIAEVDSPPLFSRFTWVISLLKSAGFEWAPIPSFQEEGSLAPFMDATEEIPKKDRDCDACDGSGEVENASGESIETCEVCHGYGHLSDDGSVQIRRTVTWAFAAEVSPEVDRQTRELYKFRSELLEAKVSDRHSTLYWLRKSVELMDRGKPSERIRQVEGLVGTNMPREARELLRDALQIYKGLCWKLQATKPHPVFKEPLHRHIVIRQGKKKAYIRADWSPDRQRKKLMDYGML